MSSNQNSLFKAAITGVTAFSADLVILRTLHSHFNLALKVSLSVAYLAGFCVSYIGTRNLVFRSNISHAKGMMRYISLAAINYLVNITIIPLLVTFSVNYLIAKIFVVGGMFIFNFIIGSNFIFTNLNSSRDS